MNAFLWTQIVLLTMTCIGKLVLLATGDMPQRTPRAEAFDVVLNGALLCWAIVLLVKE